MTIRVELIASRLWADNERPGLEVPAFGCGRYCAAVRCRQGDPRARAIPSATTDQMATVNDKSIDAVLVAAPDEFHKQLILASLAVGKPVLCEKPMAPTPQDCTEIIAAEQKLGKRLIQIGYNRRFDPAYWEMRDHWKNGGLGEAVIFHGYHRNVSAPPWFDFDHGGHQRRGARFRHCPLAAGDRDRLVAGVPATDVRRRRHGLAGVSGVPGGERPVGQHRSVDVWRLRLRHPRRSRLQERHRVVAAAGQQRG